MARASDADLDLIDDVLDALRVLPGVTERKRGVFNRGRDAYVHFRAEDGVVLADAKLKTGASFTRFPLKTKADHTAFVKALPSA